MRDRLAGMQLSSLTQRGNNAQSSRNKSKFILKRNDCDVSNCSFDNTVRGTRELEKLNQDCVSNVPQRLNP